LKSSVTLRKITSESQELVQSILDAAPSYYMKIDGVTDAGSAKSVFEELPPNCTFENKHVLLIEEASIPVGVIDLVIGYPDSKVAFIGLLVLDEKYQGRGLGKRSYQVLEDYIRQFPVDSIQLGVNDTNDVGMLFWPKMGYKLQGRTRINQGINVTSTVYVMEKQI
jgi:GNAT superfamily N-acetyltransferase